MAYQFRFSFLLFIFMALTALGQTETTVTSNHRPSHTDASQTPSKWDDWVKDSLQRPNPESEYFSLEGSSCSPYCPPGWVTYGRRCFVYVAQRMKWTSAEKHCWDLGAHLVSIHDEDEYQLVKALIRAHDPTEFPTWIGLHDCQTRHDWFWSDNTQLKFTKWNPGEPSFSYGECCVHINFSKFMNWNDIPCINPHPFVCAKKLK